jgi:hypothetical protein
LFFSGQAEQAKFQLQVTFQLQAKFQVQVNLLQAEVQVRVQVRAVAAA